MSSYSTYGVTQFRRNDTLQLKGRIKEQPCDFVVKEINLQGRIAGTLSVIQNAENILKEICSGRIKKQRIDTEVGNVENQPEKKVETSQQVSVQDDSLDSIDWEVIKADPEKHLLSLIGEEKMKLLRESSSIKYSKNKEEVILGIFDSKKDRSILHQCVRQCFPNLKSIPFKKKKDSGNDIEVTWIRCIHDPSHSDLIKMGVSEKLVNQFMLYVNCRLLRGTMEKEVPIMLLVPNLDKDARSRLHHYLQKQYGKFLESKTLGQSSNTISVRFKERKSSKLKRKREQVHRLVLKKTNMELLNVVSHLANELNVSVSHIRYAGIKDKVAVTTQFVTVCGVSLSDIEQVSKKAFKEWSVEYDPITSPDDNVIDELQLGDLAGNQFNIVVRDLKSRDQGTFLCLCLFFEYHYFVFIYLINVGTYIVKS